MERNGRHGHNGTDGLMPLWLAGHLREGRQRLAERREHEAMLCRERHARQRSHWQSLVATATADLEGLAPYANWVTPAQWSLASQRHEVLLSLPTIGLLAATYQWSEGASWQRWSFRQLEPRTTYLWGVPVAERLQVGPDDWVMQNLPVPQWHSTDHLGEALALAVEESQRRVKMLLEGQDNDYDAQRQRLRTVQAQAVPPWRDIVPGWVSVG